MEQGYIILPRNFFSADFWQQARVFSEAEAWIDIVASVRYADGSATIKVNGKSVNIVGREWPASLRFLANRWQWTIRHVRTFLDKLIASNLVSVRKCGAQNIIRVISDGNINAETTNDTDSGTTSDTGFGTTTGTGFGTTTGTGSDTSISHKEKYNNKQNVSRLSPYDNYLDPISSASHRHIDDTLNGTPTDTPSGTKKNKDINNIINDNNAREHESIQQEINEMTANHSWQESICIRHHITPSQLTDYLELFAADCMCCGRQRHQSQTDAFSHFHHWLRIQLKNNSSTQSTHSSNYSSNIHHYASHSSQPNSADLIRDAQQWAISQSQRLIRKTESRHGHLQETFSV